MPDIIQIVTTAPDKESAQRIAQALVEGRLAACVQVVGPVESVYRWQGLLESALEWQISIKTTATRFAEVAGAIRKLHSYVVPEILALPVVGGDADYIRWLIESVGEAAPDAGSDNDGSK
jgi:periplasmic divalent cation tolerance protein